jgi:hypothetical protein
VLLVYTARPAQESQGLGEVVKGVYLSKSRSLTTQALALTSICEALSDYVLYNKPGFAPEIAGDCVSFDELIESLATDESLMAVFFRALMRAPGTASPAASTRAARRLAAAARP